MDQIVHLNPPARCLSPENNNIRGMSCLSMWDERKTERQKLQSYEKRRREAAGMKMSQNIFFVSVFWV